MKYIVQIPLVKKRKSGVETFGKISPYTLTSSIEKEKIISFLLRC